MGASTRFGEPMDAYQRQARADGEDSSSEDTSSAAIRLDDASRVAIAGAASGGAVKLAALLMPLKIATRR